MESAIEHQEALQQWRDLLACMASIRLAAQRPRLNRPAIAAVRVFVRRPVVRLHAARGAIGDGAATLIARAPYQSPIGTAASGFRASGARFKNFEGQVTA
jgi:hypothetical protein